MKLKKLNFSIDKEEFAKLKREVDFFLETLEKEIKRKVDADVFLGGSFAKGTLSQSEEYDADIFIRFDWKYENLSDLLEEILEEVVENLKLKMKRLHGSRDYFRVYSDRKLTFEVIPVVRIKNIREARNVTDLSYFHVNYVKKNFNEKMRKELTIAKKFFKANRLYGAESYIHGFSGYGLECLIAYYKSFEKMLKELVKIKKDERLVVDIKKFYKKKNDVFFELNESKLNSPIILIDPTWKERNVLASLNKETFERFKEVAREFLKKPSENFFYDRGFDEERIKKKAKNKEYLHLVLATNRQEGDIAGTKMKKFSELLEKIFGEYFVIIEKDFLYPGEGNSADFYLALASKKEILRAGPPLDKKENVKRFKEVNKKTLIRGNAIYSKIMVDFTAKEFLQKWKQSKEGQLKMVDMGISGIKVESKD
jgi:tRNA nucleotidyltransferase (CCA-adding enzyme)